MDLSGEKAYFTICLNNRKKKVFISSQLGYGVIV